MQLLERRAIFCFPSDMGREQCWPTPVRLVTGHLGKELRNGARQWIETRAKEGEEYQDTYDIHVYGPFPSQDRIAAMLTKADMAITKEERDSYVEEHTNEAGAFALYLLNAIFAGPEGLVTERTGDG